MSHAEQESEAEKCEIATNAAMEVAMEKCSSDGLLSNIAPVVGLSETPDPEDVPDELSPVDCMEMDAVREWVAVRARELIEKEDEGMVDALGRAWAEAGDECGW